MEQEMEKIVENTLEKQSESQEQVQEETKNLWKDDRGIGVVEVILVLVIVVGLVLIFQSEIKEIVTDALNAVSGGADRIIG